MANVAGAGVLLAGQTDLAASQISKYLTFDLAGEVYGVDISYVVEITGIQHITAMPDLPDFLRGVINLRGKVIPVLDVRRYFRLEAREYDERTCIIVVNVQELHVGLVVDEVRDVADIDDEQIEHPPLRCRHHADGSIKGVAKVGGEVRILLHVAKILANEGLETVGQA